jgi:hypothetical protein
MAGLLFTPPNFDKTKKYPALPVVHPFGGVKEQTASIYARKMAEKGYVTLAFDASHQGESGGYPRDTENPADRMEDVRCAVDYLTTLPMVDENRIGLLGVCAGGSYVMATAPTEMRAKAVACVSLWDLQVTARAGWPAPEYDRAAVLVEIGIIGAEAATIFMSKAGYEKAAKPKEWFEVPGATHHRLYDDEAAVTKAVGRLDEFFGRNL